MKADGTIEEVPGSKLRAEDVVVVRAGEFIPGDGEVVEGVASVDESAITGESAPVIRESGGDRSAVTGGTRVLSDEIMVKITSNPGETFLDRMIKLVEGAERQKTPNEIALNILLAGLTIIFLLAVVTLAADGDLFGRAAIDLRADLAAGVPDSDDDWRIAFRDRHCGNGPRGAAQRAGDVGTRGGSGRRRGYAAARQDRNDHAGQSARDGIHSRAGRGGSRSGRRGAACFALGRNAGGPLDRGAGEGEIRTARAGACVRGDDFIPFSATTRMSGVDLDGREIRKGAFDAIVRYAAEGGNRVPSEVEEAVKAIANAGGTPLLVAEDRRVLGTIYLKDIVKGGMRERFDQLRAMGIRTVMITGDNPLTAAAIAREAGVDDFLAQAKPEDKLALIRREQAKGKLVAMTGDGTNDAPALAQADVGVAMNAGTQAAKEAGNMVDLDSNPTKLIEIVEIGKQLLITRGALTTFSVANDVAKYFAIIPAMFAGAFPQLERAEHHGARRRRNRRFCRP